MHNPTEKLKAAQASMESYGIQRQDETKNGLTVRKRG